MHGGTMMRVVTPAVPRDSPQLEVEGGARRLRARVRWPLTDLNFVWNILAANGISCPWC